MAIRKPIILLVDDNEDNRLIYRAMLEHHGFHVLAVADGESALRAARRSRPALVLMDIDLPGMDGWTATALLRSDPITRDAAVIALTARDDESDIDRALALGCSAYLVKPCAPGTVTAEVTRVLRARGRDVETSLGMCDVA